MRLCKRANVKNKTKKERGREEEEEETERKVEKPRTLYKWVHVQRRSFLGQDKESPPRNERNDSETLSKKYVILALNDRRPLSARGVSPGASR